MFSETHFETIAGYLVHAFSNKKKCIEMKSTVCWSSLSITCLAGRGHSYFQQIIGIAMRPSLLANSFLYLYETELHTKTIKRQKSFGS